MKQTFFRGFEPLTEKEFGGTNLKGNARTQRPISLKRPMHLVMRSSLAVRELSFLNPKRAKQIQKHVYELGEQKGVEVYCYANGGSHLQLIVRPHSRKAFNGFIRALSGLITRITLGVERGKPLNLKFWDSKPFTRILEWGSEYERAKENVFRNSFEAPGFAAYKPRGRAKKPIRRETKKTLSSGLNG